MYLKELNLMEAMNDPIRILYRKQPLTANAGGEMSSPLECLKYEQIPQRNCSINDRGLGIREIAKWLDDLGSVLRVYYECLPPMRIEKVANKADPVLEKKDFGPLLDKTMKSHITQKNLQEGFRTSSWFPWNPSAVGV
ncbi:hypothetical protein PR048_012606 [Dryococelus australis]|uniref:Uncharacterized protein n=1 Tax=Dryococelus australis TaxID=614101 RepID=A0ABQ9HPV5_9NEOP|nr:hypothetical protein PR048_012606 [Dryococelus australis]